MSDWERFQAMMHPWPPVRRRRHRSWLAVLFCGAGATAVFASYGIARHEQAASWVGYIVASVCCLMLVALDWKGHST